MKAHLNDEPLFFRDDVIHDPEGRAWRVLDTPNRVRLGGSNKPAYIITSSDNLDTDVESGHKIWVRDANDIESGRFTAPDGRGYPDGRAPDVIPIRGWAVIDYCDYDAITQAIITVKDTGLHGLFVVIRDVSCLDQAEQDIRHAIQRADGLPIGVSVPSIDGEGTLHVAGRCGAKASWIQDCGVDTGRWNTQGKAIRAAYHAMDDHTLFAGVSFLDSDRDPDLAASVDAVQKADMIPITSGSTEELRAIRERAAAGRLAMAGGLDPVSVEPFLAYITDAIASNGISLDYHTLHRAKCKGFAESCNERYVES